MSSSRLLRHALPLIKTHGFTRETLALSALSLPTPHSHPLSDTAVTALFGRGDEARKTLIHAWLQEGQCEMGKLKDQNEHAQAGAHTPSVGVALKARLRWNEPVIQYLPEAFALIASPTSGLPPFDLKPLLVHAATVADEACHVAGELGPGTSWYTRRASLAAIYSAAELHQMTSPQTAYDFLDNLLQSSHAVESTIGEVSLFAQYIVDSAFKGINPASKILVPSSKTSYRATVRRALSLT